MVVFFVVMIALLAAVPTIPAIANKSISTPISLPSPDLKQIPRNVCNFDKKEPIKVAIIDSGLDLKDTRFKNHICKTGHKDLTGTGIKDVLSHGTFIASLIQDAAGDGNYCFVIYKWISVTPGKVETITHAFEEVSKDKANVINFSGGGGAYSQEEHDAVAMNKDSIIVVAAGNNSMNIDMPKTAFYPASYDDISNIIPVMNINKMGGLASTSNWTSRGVKEMGENVYGFLPTPLFAGYDSGTSASAAIRSGKIVNYMLHYCK